MRSAELETSDALHDDATLNSREPTVRGSSVVLDSGVATLSLNDRIIGCLQGGTVGDAIGAHWEGRDRQMN